MGESRVKNVRRNMIFGMINKLVVIGLPFIIRTIIIYQLGVNYLGLSSLFSAILQVLNMAELGFSSAITFHLYKPLAEEDEAKVCALVALYRKIYLVIGVGILAVGALLTPFLNHLINGEYPKDINIYVLYIIYLVNTSISYLFLGYKSVLLSASQRQDILNNTDTILSLCKSGIQIAVLLLVPNYYLYIIWNPIITIVNNMLVSYMVDKKFPSYKYHGKLGKEEINSIIQLVEGSAIGKIGMVARNSCDSIILSTYLGLVQVAIYSNYFCVLNAVSAMLTVMIQSVTASVGNSLAVESIEKNYSDFKKINFYYHWIAGWACVCLLCLYQPFMRLWVGAELCTPMITVILFCVYFYICQMGQVRSVYAVASGIWWEFRYLQVGEIIGNISLNFILGYYFGMNGIIIATIITVFTFSVVGIGKKTISLCFRKNAKEYFQLLLVYTLITIAACLITYGICSRITGTDMYILFVRLVICIVVPNLLFFVVTMVEQCHRNYLFQLKTMFRIR